MRDILKKWKFSKEKFGIFIEDPQNPNISYEVVDYSPFRQKVLCDILELLPNKTIQNYQKSFDIEDLNISHLDIVLKQ